MSTTSAEKPKNSAVNQRKIIGEKICAIDTLWLLFNYNEFTHPKAWRPFNIFSFQKNARKINLENRQLNMRSAVWFRDFLSQCLNGRNMEINSRLTQVHAPSEHAEGEEAGLAII